MASNNNSKSISTLIQEMYETFKGTPSEKPIVRNNIVNDAFAVVVLKLLYGERRDIRFERNNVSEIARYVIAPPDAGIDILVPRESGDNIWFDVIQVKNSSLTRVEIQNQFLYMKDTIDKFCKKATNVSSESCRETLNNSGLDKSNKKNCHYYVVHTGDIHGNVTDNKDETVLNVTDLEIINNSVKYKVVEEEFKIGAFKNILYFGDVDESQNAYVCNINCYDLAKLDLKYYSTDAGRNILFGYNLRESLDKNISRSFKGMQKTLLSEPGNFWYYNNGITIVSENATINEKSDNTTLSVNQFSIVNGAQTTSTLGYLLSTAERDQNTQLIENMKNAYVIARILNVADENIQKKIAIYNNTQNPIDMRDMIATNDEQVRLHELLLDETYPQIFMENRRGSHLPNTFNKQYSHRITTNDTLAQLAYAGFELSPGIAKDKKSALFNNDGTDEYILNEYYDKMFAWNNSEDGEKGLLFKKSKLEIDELLFTQTLYKYCKTYLKKIYQDNITKTENKKLTASAEMIKTLDATLSQYGKINDTIGICMLYFVTTYYQFLTLHGDEHNEYRYDFDKFYSSKQYREEVVKDASSLFLMRTVNTLIKGADANVVSNMNNWVRGKKCPECFKDDLSKSLTQDIELVDKYHEFMNKYKTIKI